MRRRLFGLPLFTAVVMAAFGCGGETVRAQELVHFPSLEDNGPGQSSTMLDGYLFRVVFTVTGKF